MDSPAFFYEEIPTSGWDTRVPGKGKTVNQSQYIKCVFSVMMESHRSLTVWAVQIPGWGFRCAWIWSEEEAPPVSESVIMDRINHFWYKDKWQL